MHGQITTNKEKSSYLPIITADKAWHIEGGFWCPYAPPGCLCYAGLFTIKTGNLKTFNEKEYYELLLEQTYDPWFVLSYVREEDKKVFFYFEACNAEYLLYDFTLNVGDEVTVLDLYEPFPIPCELSEEELDLFYTFVVTEIGEIEYNQVRRKTLKLAWKSLPDYTDLWVEGVGSMQGICFHSTQGLSGFRRLKDCYESDKLIFENKEPFCWFYFNTNDRQQELTNIFADGNNLLRIVNAKDIPLEMYDMQGRKIKSMVPADDNYTISISNLPKGLYVVVNQNKSLIFKVIVK